MLSLETRIIDLTVADLMQLLDERYTQFSSTICLQACRKIETEKMSVDECAELTGYVADYIRQLVFKRQIPYYKTRKKLHFKHSEIIDWMYQRKVVPVDQIAEQYINRKTINHKIH